MYFYFLHKIHKLHVFPFKKKVANKTQNLLFSDVEPLHLTFVALGNNTGEPQKKPSHSEIVDISVNSQESMLALEMAED